MSNDFNADGYSRQAVSPGGGGNGRAQRPNGGPQRAGRAPGGIYGILHIIGGNDRGKQHQLATPETAIGRGADQDLILADIAVSRRHVIILMDGDRYRIKDLGSGNGTMINGVRTDTVILNDGDQIEIGNTVMRIEHGPSRAMAAAPMSSPQMQAGADNRTMMADAVSYPPQPNLAAPPPAFPQQQQQQMQQQSMGMPMGQQGYGMPAPVPQQPTPSEPIAMPPSQRPPSQALPVPVHTGSHQAGGGILDTPGKKAAVFGAIGLILVLGGALVVKKFVLGGGEAQKYFTDGQKAFADQDYGNAKRLFASALAADPELPQAAKYLKQCDVELHGRGALKTANGLVAAKRWVEVLKTLDTIDKSSAAYKEADEIRKTAIPSAIEHYLADAKDLINDDPDGAQAKVDAALALDPENEDALAVDKQLKGAGGGTKVAAADKPNSRESRGSRESRSVAVRPTPVPARDAEPPRVATKIKNGGKPIKGGDDDDDGLIPVGKGGGGGGAFEIMTSKAGGPYKAKDFSGAASALRSEKASAAQGLSAQVALLGSTFNKAEADRTKNVQGAVTEYQQALAIDTKVGHGYHGGYIKGQLGKLEKQLAQQAFQQQKFDVAFDAAKSCAKFGSDDGGVLNQLKAKAGELNARAAGMAKSNLNGAKSLWRMVVRMVPPGDPNFAKATQGLNSAQKASSDEDE